MQPLLRQQPLDTIPLCSALQGGGAAGGGQRPAAGAGVAAALQRDCAVRLYCYHFRWGERRASTTAALVNASGASGQGAVPALNRTSEGSDARYAHHSISSFLMPLPAAESDLAVTEGLQEAIAEVMAWNDTVSASSSSGSHSLQAHAGAAGALAAAAAAMLLLL